MIDRDYMEKRSFMRMNMDAPAVLQMEDGTQKHCICKDLSAVGMLIEVDQALPIGTRFQVHLPALTGQFAPLDAAVLVQRVDEMGSGKYQLGLEIEQIK